MRVSSMRSTSASGPLRGEGGVDHLTHEERVRTAVEFVSKGTVEVPECAIEHRRAGDGSVVVGDSCKGSRLAIVYGRLDEMSHSGSVFPPHERDRERAAGGDEDMGVGVALDRHCDELRLERNLSNPVAGHDVAVLSCPRPDDVDAARESPEHAATPLVVLLGVRAARDRTDDLGSRHVFGR